LTSIASGGSVNRPYQWFAFGCFDIAHNEVRQATERLAVATQALDITKVRDAFPVISNGVEESLTIR
jgi:hypothetical protein